LKDKRQLVADKLKARMRHMQYLLISVIGSFKVAEQITNDLQRSHTVIRNCVVR